MFYFSMSLILKKEKNAMYCLGQMPWPWMAVPRVCEKAESSNYEIGRGRRLSNMFYSLRKVAHVFPGKPGFIQVKAVGAPWDCLQI